MVFCGKCSNFIKRYVQLKGKYQHNKFSLRHRFSACSRCLLFLFRYQTRYTLSPTSIAAGIPQRDNYCVLFSVAFYRPQKRLCAVCARQNAIIDLRFATFQSHNMITTLNKIKLPISLESFRRTNNIWKKWITVEHRARSTSNEF